MTERLVDRNAERVERRRRVAKVVREEGLQGARQVARRLGIPVTTAHRDLEALELLPERPANAPPAPVGNGRAMTHGLDSERVLRGVIAPRAAELAPSIIAANPHLDQSRDGLAVLRYARVLACLERAYWWLAEQPDDLFADVEKGVVHALYSRVALWERQASRDEERLAISPRERTRLKLDQVKGRLLLGAEGAPLDFTGFSDEELETFVRLRAKAGSGVIEGGAA
jgi:hypothetical protein